MALTNAEKQAAWRARQAGNAKRVAELEKEVAQLKSTTSQDAVTNRPKPSEFATGHRFFDDIDAKRFTELLEQQIIDGKASPLALAGMARNISYLSSVYWGSDGKRGTRKRLTDEQKMAVQRKQKEAHLKRQAKVLAG